MVPALLLATVMVLFLSPFGSALLTSLFPAVPTSPVRPTVEPTKSVPTGTLVSTVTPNPSGTYPSLLKVWSAAAELRAVSDPTTDPSEVLRYLDVVTYLSGPDEHEYLQVRAADGKVGFVPYYQLVDASLYLYADIPVATLSSVVPNSKDKPKPSDLVDVRRYAPSMSVDLLFAHPKNIAGKVLYARDLCLLQRGTLDKLRNAQAMFQKSGYSIKIYDAYRPYSVSKILADLLGTAGFKADVKDGSSHNRGAAVDMTIVDKNGREIQMPGPIQSTTSSASRGTAMSAAVRRNLDYVEGIMVACGFTPLGTEWWHYTDSQAYLYPYMDVDFATMPLVAVLDPPESTPPPLVDESQRQFFSITPPPAP